MSLPTTPPAVPAGAARSVVRRPRHSPPVGSQSYAMTEAASAVAVGRS